MTTVLDQAQGENWIAYCGDSIEMLRGLPDRSIDLCVGSLPFSSLYTYSPSDRDMGNVRNDDQFFEHYGFLTAQLARVMRPGRHVCIHCMQLVTYESTHGTAGLRDFRGDIIRHYQAQGFVYHAEIAIQKNPQHQAIRNHPRGLLFVQLGRDASWMRQGLADYVVVMRTPGDNPTPIKTDLTHEEWIRFAHPIWTDIRETDVLSTISAKEEPDERHLAPLQLDVIERCIRLWSNRGETVLDPYLGIGSSGVVAIKRGRRFVGGELKRSYWLCAVGNMRDAEQQAKAGDLFGWAAAQNENRYREDEE